MLFRSHGNKFKKFGLKKFNKSNGCSEDCDQYHPMACFELMKTKSCKRPECKFYHINCTKKEEGLHGLTSDNRTSQTGNTGTGNQTGSSNGNNSQCTSGMQQQQQDFQEARQPWEIAIERMANQMEKMMSLQQTFQT